MSQRARLGLLWFIGIVWVCGCSPKPHASYLQQVSDFTIGSVALQVADNGGHDKKYLKLASKIAPQEPAVWADLGLMELRASPPNYRKAAQYLRKAEQLDPNSSAIQRLLGLLAFQQGKINEAISYYQKAVQLNPNDLRARYELAYSYDQLGTPAGLQQELQQLKAILQQRPDNLFAQLQLLQVAARQGDVATLKQAISMLQTRTATFPKESLSLFAQLKAAVQANNIRQAALLSRFLENSLTLTGTYFQSRLALAGSANQIGEPILHFLKLPNPPSTPAPPDQQLSYTPQPVPTPLNHAVLAGATWLDSSGTPFLYVADAKTVWLGNGQQLAFPSGSAAVPPAKDGILPLDVNYDARMDFALAGAGGFRLYVQTPQQTFQDVTSQTHLLASLLTTPYVAAWQADLDADGNMDIILAPLHGKPLELRNNGDGTFTPLHPFADLTDARAFAWADLDDSGNPTPCFLDAQGHLHLYANLRSGLFQPEKGPALTTKLAALAVGDANPNGEIDLLALTTTGAVLRIFWDAESTSWKSAPLTTWPNAPHDLLPGKATLLMGDLDNNGGEDIVASDGHTTQIWLCDEHWHYLPYLTLPYAVTTIEDLTNNGLLDLVGTDAKGKPVELLAHSPKAYHWQELRPAPDPTEFRSHTTSTGNARINSFAIGGTMEMRAGLLYEKQPILTPVVHFGLGTYPHVDVLRTVWPNGDSSAEFLDTLKPDASVPAPHRLTGSCPFLWAWNGKEFAFVTDFLWSSPLGLRIDAQETAGTPQTTDWVKIRGDQLVPRDGLYDVRITAELWETHFFDYVALMVVDHPKGTEVWTDERFAMPPPPHQLIVTGPLHPVAWAKDDQGHDVSAILSTRDGRYLGGFGVGRFQGVTRDHWVELDLSNAPLPTKGNAPYRETHKIVNKEGASNSLLQNSRSAGSLWLVCQGWIHPTDSSINVAISHSHYPKPQSLSLWVPDAKGRWIEVRKNMGFPEGKLKTILINLDGVFRSGAPRRLRLRTNLEIYWDAIRWAVGLPKTPLHIRLLPVHTAVLRYRGFSDIRAKDAFSPELPVSYQVATKVEKWRDLIGYYTRYGDVRPLLTHIDDRYVIMNAGDELQLTFRALPPPPPGWTRDFIMIGDGWEKDGNYNTAFSKTVLPLPSHANPNYNRPPGPLEDDPVYQKHRQDWLTYQTRWVAPYAFMRGIRP
ncbi:Repeat domain in Vibrio, Colwellia, Bradyrhizobium and Shewanella/TPR repeat [Chthonomonas calidirosea]|nr:Repeat domain in Vibrio, Colwellia, Bradyrhizobium and Shewanella/TPR repeat [Chthonomonas calidirosea]